MSILKETAELRKYRCLDGNSVQELESPIKRTPIISSTFSHESRGDKANEKRH